MNTYFKLPKKWCIKRSIENYKELNPLLKQINGKTYTGTGSNLYHTCDYFHNVPFRGERYLQGYKHRAYTEITLTQLKNSLNIMENFAIKADSQNPLFMVFIRWTNEKYRTDWAGNAYDGTYYTIVEGRCGCFTVEREGVQTVTLEYWNENIRNEKIIGYRLIKPEYKEPASTIGGFSNFDTFEKFKTVTFPHIVEDYVQIAKKLKDAGVLNLWFEPVYAETAPQLPIINKHKGTIEGDIIKYGCAELDIAWFKASNNRSITDIKLDSGVVINKEQIEQIRKVLIHAKHI